MLALLRRLDRYATDEPGFRKPRLGACGLCDRPTIQHPLWAHRRAAAFAWFVSTFTCSEMHWEGTR